eukprot:SAG31_NODE_3670_length_4002_cov_17.262875_1_plen_745_part_00
MATTAAVRRLDSVTSHVSPQLSQPSGGAAQVKVQRRRPVLLDDDAMQSFVYDGYVLLGTTAELPEKWHASVVQKAATVVARQPAKHTRPSSVAPGGAAVDQATLWKAMSSELIRVVSSRTVCGALASILGKDFIVSAGGHMHEAAPLDQFWHRDGSVRGVREHSARGLILMYYPNGCTLEMGCTAVCRGSQFLTVDRHRWPNSEDRLDVGVPPQALASDEQALTHWRMLDEKARRVPSVEDPVARNEALAAPISKLGLRAENAEVRVVVPPGGVLLCHRECFHRATRAMEGAAWRPMFKMGASRVCDPVCPSWAFCKGLRAAAAKKSSDPTADVIARAQWSWHCGTVTLQQPTAGLTESEMSYRTNMTWNVCADPAATEAARISAAYTLGEMVVVCHGASTAAAARRLLQNLDAEAEAVRRAASYGLRSALLTHTMQQANPQQQHLAEALLMRLQSPFEGCGGTVGGSAAVVYTLAAAPMPYKVTATALAAFVVRTVAELATHTAAQPAALLDQWRPLLSDRVQLEVPLDFYVLDRRLALSECCGALASVGERAVRSGECDTVQVVTRVLVALVTANEPGQSFPTYFGPSNGQVIRMQAAFALLRVCSDPNLSSDIGVEHGQTTAMLCSRPEWVATANMSVTQPQHDTVAATVDEALRRLRLLCSITAPSQLVGVDRTQKAREHLLAILESEAFPWCRIPLEDQRERSSGIVAGGGVVLQHCSTAAPFPAVLEVGVQSLLNHSC